MSDPILNGKINLIDAVSLDGENLEWSINFSFIDYEGAFLPNQIAAGDCLYFDTSAEYLGTITRYKITNVKSVTEQNVSCDVVFFDNNTNVPDLSFAIGLDGAISRPTENFENNIAPAPGSQLIPDKFLVYPGNSNSENIDRILEEKVSSVVSGLTTGVKINNIVALSQEEYDGLTPDANTLYVIND